MKQFSRTPEEMRENYERALVTYGDEDLSKDGTKEKDRVYPTAFITARCFAEQTNIPNAKELYASFCEQMGFVKGENEPDQIDTPHFMELRYLSSEKVIRSAVERGEVEQVVELASGFTPHSVNLLNSEGGIKNYIENDFAVNLEVKKKAVNDFVGGIPVVFIPGNVLAKETWEKIEAQLTDGPVAIFCEGLMMYLSRDQQIEFFNNIKEVLKKKGGFFMHEDILKYHPELKENPAFTSITNKLKAISGNTALDESFTQESIAQFYESLGFVVERVPEDVPLSIDNYPEHIRENARILQHLGFQMWKLSLPKE
jgi:O-methyltransferase involved in polyketide biosynthesis